MDKLTLAVVLVLVLGYTQARPYYPYHGYYVPWYPVSPCDPYPPAPCQAYPYPSPCGGQPAPRPRPTPCNPQPKPAPNQPPPEYNKETEEEAILTQDLNDIRRVREWSQQVPLHFGKYSQYLALKKKLASKYPSEFNTDEYRALKQKPPPRRNRIGNRRQYDEGEHYGGYGRGMAPAVYRDQAEDMEEYDEEYEEYDRGMDRGVYRDEGDYGHDEDDDEDDY